ncbi:MAG: sodium/panthothenate symporter [Firmicutes bacterium]|nr:sodium/panthothenate symporter [Bacillota bacterium]
MGQAKVDVLIPLILYFLFVYFLGFYSLKFVSRARQTKGKNFLVEYLIGGRSLGGFVLAMTLVATYLSAGSFIGGPGAAYTYGLAWVYLAMTQMPTGYFTLAVLGKKFAIIARKINAVTMTDFLKERYENKLVIILCSLSIVFFFTASMAAQWIGAARLLEGSVGLSYTTALTFFGVTVLVYTTIGGYRAVALTDTLQGVVMTVGTAAVIIAAIIVGGGVSNLVNGLYAIHPGLISPYGVDPQFTSAAWVTSYWILVGFAIVGLPQVAVRAMSYRDSKSLKEAIIYGTIVSMVLLLGMHLLGAFGRVLIPGIEAGDLVVPTIITSLFPNWAAGIILAGPLAAVMSTVDSQLLLAVGAIVNDIYVNLINPRIKKTASLAFAASVFLGIIIFIVAYNPPPLMVWLNLYAHGGTIATFLWPIILGLYWKKANAQGALASIITGIGSYMLFHNFWPRPLGMHTIVLPLIISLATFVIVSLFTPGPSKKIIERFWGP